MRVARRAEQQGSSGDFIHLPAPIFFTCKTHGSDRLFEGAVRPESETPPSRVPRKARAPDRCQKIPFSSF